MPRLYLFAEGQTEQAFASRILGPHLASHGVYLQGAILTATSRRHGTTHRGGGRKYLNVKQDVERLLKQESGPDVFFTTMIDLYSIYQDMPGRERADTFRDDPRRRVHALEEAFAADVGDRRFIPYIQLHEFEAILFVDPSHFGLFYENARRGIAELNKVAESFEGPEWIDDGQHSAPSKRIAAQFPAYAHHKPVAGPQIAESIGLQRIRDQCPHFASWLERLEEIGGTEKRSSS